MTSNLGSHDIQRMSAEGIDADLIKEAVMGEVKRHFRPEFVNRIDEIVVFHALGVDHIRSIARIQLKRLEQRMHERDLVMTVTERALDEIAKVGFDPVYGARPLKRAIQQHIENPVARAILEGRYAPNDVVPVDFDGGQFVFQRTVH